MGSTATRPLADVAPKGRPRRRVGRARRLAVELQNRALLERDLAAGRTEFASRPHEAYVQFTNFCNMSCVMCHNGANPPLQRMSRKVLDRVERELAPTLSVIIPHGASEPLIIGWDEARRIARDHSIDLRVTTNVQFLDEPKFRQVSEVAETLFLSIDSHIPEIYAWIRRRSRPERVFANIATAARLARDAELECMAQTVLMTANGPTMPETIAWLARMGVQSVNMLQLVDGNGQSGMLDPVAHFSPEYLDSIKVRCIDAARECEMRLIWNVGTFERHDFRRHKVPPKLRKDIDARWVKRLRRRHPGFCQDTVLGVQVHTDGLVTPCCFSSERDLPLGRLGEQSFDDIWNGPSARDLRRALRTWDFPELCASCPKSALVAPEVYLPFVDQVLEQLGIAPLEMECVLEACGPDHMTRTTEAPTIELRGVPHGLHSFVVAFAFGGERGELTTFEATPAQKGGRVRIPVPLDAWRGLRANTGYWWTVLGLANGMPRALRSRELRCVIRHEPLPRVAGSRLRYPEKPVARRPAESRRTLGPGKASVQQPWDRMSRVEYGRMTRCLRTAVGRALPREGTVAVVSRGDPELLDLDGRRAWHFPTGPTGEWLGYHPADSAAAVDHLEQMRARGADYLVLPAVSRWWLAHYPGFATHLIRRSPLVHEDEACSIYAIGDAPALYGRTREQRLRARQLKVAELVSRLEKR